MYRDLTKRILALALSVCMIAGMVDLSGLTVRAAVQDLWQGSIEFTDTTPIVYDGGEHEPAVTVKDFAGNSLSEGTDYSLEYSNNVNAGTATVTATNVDDPDDTLEETFNIGKRDINSCDGFPDSASLAQEIASSSTTVTPQVSVTDSGNKDHQALVGRMSDSTVAGVDYTYSFKNNRGPGTATVTITGRNNYEGSKDITFTISLLEGSKITFDIADDLSNGAAYTGQEIKPAIDDTVAYDGNKINKSDYQVRYRNNVYAGVAEIWIEVTGGRYSGLRSESKTFNIRKNIGSGNNIKFTQKIKLGKPIPDKPYKGATGVELDEEDLVLIDPDYENTPMKLGVDYEITRYENNTSEGTATVRIQGIGKYTGTRAETFEIVTARLTDPSMVNPYGAGGKATYTYDINADGSDKDQFEEVKKNVIVSNGDVTYTEGADYTVSRAPAWC